MANDLPNDETLEQIAEGLAAANAKNPNALGIAVAAYQAGDFVPNTLKAWLAKQRLENPKLFTPPRGIPDPTDDSDIPDANAVNGLGGVQPPKGTSNPFTKAAWSITEQGRLVKLNPRMAAALAKAANVKIGATRPVM
jgi:hypothetical protein